MKESREYFQVWHCFWGTMQPMSPQLEPWVNPGRLGSPHLYFYHCAHKGICTQGSLPIPSPCQLLSTSAPFPRNFPTGHILAIPQLPSWAGLTSQVEKHQSHSFHVKSSHCGLSSLGGCRAWRQGPVAWGSQLLYLRTGLTAHQSQRSVGERAAIPPASLSTSAEILGCEPGGRATA